MQSTSDYQYNIGGPIVWQIKIYSIRHFHKIGR
jgi:hypothetical protein